MESSVAPYLLDIGLKRTGDEVSSTTSCSPGNFSLVSRIGHATLHLFSFHSIVYSQTLGLTSFGAWPCEAQKNSTLNSNTLDFISYLLCNEVLFLETQKLSTDCIFSFCLLGVKPCILSEAILATDWIGEEVGEPWLIFQNFHPDTSQVSWDGSVCPLLKAQKKAQKFQRSTWAWYPSKPC